jgi:hypothetical protein
MQKRKKKKKKRTILGCKGLLFATDAPFVSNSTASLVPPPFDALLESVDFV